jgi:hypothetical protein
MASNRHRVELTSENGTTANLLLGGKDVGGSVLGLEFQVGYGKAPRLYLDIAAYPLSVDFHEAAVYLTDETSDLLIQLGWTPPEEETADVMD